MTQAYVIGQSGQVYYLTGFVYTASVSDTFYTADACANIDECFAADYAVLSDSVACSLKAEDPIADSFVGQDGLAAGGAVWFELQRELLNPTDAFVVSNHAQELMAEALKFFALQSGSNHLVFLVEEISSVLENVEGAYGLAISDSATVTPALSAALSVLILSTARLSGYADFNQVLVARMQEVCQVGARVLLGFTRVIDESITVAALLAATRFISMTAADRALLSGALLQRASIAKVLEEAIAFVGDGPRTTGIGDAQETVTFLSNFASLAYLTAAYADFAKFTAEVSATHRVFLGISDSAVIIDPPTLYDPTQLLNILIQEQALFHVGWIADDGTWDGFVVNANTSAVSEYQGWDFNSFGQFYGQYLAASPTQGLCVLGGLSDGSNPIQAAMMIAGSDFGTSRQKRVRSAYLGIAAEGTCYLQVLTDDNIQRTYQMVPNAPGISTERVDLPRGLSSRYWAFGLQSVDGSAWRLDMMDVLPVVLTRRVNT